MIIAKLLNKNKGPLVMKRILCSIFKVFLFLEFIFFNISLAFGIISPPQGVFISSVLLRHSNITSTVFWVGEEASSENGNISNVQSAWDENWLENYGGVDDPNDRDGYFPKKFWPKENPFYVALPFNDLNEYGIRKKRAIFIPWFSKYKNLSVYESILKDRWVKIIKNDKVAYAQWEDVGPFGEDDYQYVFGTSLPENEANNQAGIDVSPAVRDFLALKDIDKVDWEFVEFEDVPPGPWLAVITNRYWHWFHPRPDSTFYWQLQGEINIQRPEEIFDIDLFDSDESLISHLKETGHKVICYFSAGSAEKWRDDFTLFSEKELGNVMNDWPDERWLDIRSENVKRVMEQRIRLAAQKGCDGIEPDNIDGYQNDTGFDLSYSDQLEYNKFLAKTAHYYGLSVALKNDLAQAKDLVRYFDFLLLENCFKYDECELSLPFIKSLKPVFDVEYIEESPEINRNFQEFCKRAKSLGINLLIMNLDLDGTFIRACP